MPVSSAGRVLLPGQVTCGDVLSATVRTMPHCEVFPAWSVTRKAMVEGPRPSRVPAAGLCAMTRAAGKVQLSDALTSATRSGTLTLPFASTDRVLFPGQVTCGGVVSTAVSTMLHCAEFPAWSVTVKVMA